MNTREKRNNFVGLSNKTALVFNRAVGRIEMEVVEKLRS